MGRLVDGWFFHFVFRLDSSGIDFDFQRPDFATSCTDALAFVSAAFSSVVRRDRLFILAMVADTEDSKDEVTPCCLTNRCRQRGMACPVSRLRRDSHHLVPRA